MTNSIKISALLASWVLLLTSCLNSNESESISYNYSNPNITKFSLTDNTDVCKALGNYSFTIDNQGSTDPELIEYCRELWDKDKYTVKPGIIFNPDSLPNGSEPDSIKVNITYNSPSSVKFYQYNELFELENVTNFADTTTISFDDYAFTRLEVVAYDGFTNKSYFVKVNVHQLYGDTLAWKYFNTETFDATTVKEQHVDTIGTTLYWYTETEDGTQEVRINDNINGDITLWSNAETLSGNLKLSSMYADKNTLYAVAKNGSLMQSNDGKNWNTASNDFEFYNLLGTQLGVKLNGKVYNEERMLAIVKKNGEYHFAQSADGNSWELAILNSNTNSSLLPSNFPIDGYSMPISVAAQPKSGNVTSRVYLVGGITQEGILCNSTWSCDGKTWIEFPQGLLPAMKGASIVQYTRDTDKPGTFWILHPGEMVFGEVSREMWFSENSGVTWKKLSREFSEMADTRKIEPMACGSAFFSPVNYNIYYFGGIDADGKQITCIHGGNYRELLFAKVR